MCPDLGLSGLLKFWHCKERVQLSRYSRCMGGTCNLMLRSSLCWNQRNVLSRKNLLLKCSKGWSQSVLSVKSLCWKHLKSGRVSRWWSWRGPPFLKTQMTVAHLSPSLLDHCLPTLREVCWLVVLWGSALRDVGRTGKGRWGEAGLAKGNTEGVPPVTWPISGGAGQEGMSLGWV